MDEQRVNVTKLLNENYSPFFQKHVECCNHTFTYNDLFDEVVKHTQQGKIP